LDADIQQRRLANFKRGADALKDIIARYSMVSEEGDDEWYFDPSNPDPVLVEDRGMTALIKRNDKGQFEGFKN
jgi:hypothetical protein